jgi:hypothetical protein
VSVPSKPKVALLESEGPKCWCVRQRSSELREKRRQIVSLARIDKTRHGKAEWG